MYLGVVWDTLVFNVIGNSGHIGITNGISVVTTRPEVTSPELCLHFWMMVKEIFSGDAFDFLYQV